MKKQLVCNELMGNDQVDIAHLIGSIQCLEKNPDCFGVAEIQSHCDGMNCAWRRLCLEKPQDHQANETPPSIEAERYLA